MDYELTYVSDDLARWGVGTGVLMPTAASVDLNFAKLEERVWELENNPPSANSIANIFKTNNQLTVVMQNATTFGPFDLETAEWRFLEDGWLPDVGMFKHDVFVYRRAGFYHVNHDHVAASEFDPDAVGESGQLYEFMFNPFAGMATNPIPETTDLVYSPTLLDANNYLTWDGADDVTILMLLNADMPHPLDTEIGLNQAGAGKIIVTGVDGVTILPSRPGFSTATPWQGASAAIKQVAIDTWQYIGAGTEGT